MRIKPIKEFRRALTPPPDKSVTIRAALMGLIAKGVTVIKNPSLCLDAVSAFNMASDSGAYLNFKDGAMTVEGTSISGDLKLYAGNSATAMRLFAGALSSMNCNAVISGDGSLSGRSMAALVDVLKTMGADISGKRPPIVIKGQKLHGINFVPDHPSAQIKGAVLMAGLCAEGETTVTEKIKTRTHTEDMLKAFGADISIGETIRLMPSSLTATEVDVFGDISAAAYPMALALKRGFCYIKNVGLVRYELIDFLKGIGGDIEVENRGDRGNLTVRESDLKPFVIEGALSAALIDELPLLAALACVIDGKSIIKDASALKNKECDRIKYTAANLANMGADIKATDDGFIICGGKLRGGNAITAGDHRMAMTMAVANALSEKGGFIDDDKCVEVSYPSFWELFL